MIRFKVAPHVDVVTETPIAAEFAEVFSKVLKMERLEPVSKITYKKFKSKMEKIVNVSRTQSGRICDYKGIRYHIIEVPAPAMLIYKINILKIHRG